MGYPAHTKSPRFITIMLGIASPVDVISNVRFGDFPRITMTQPFIGDFGLTTVANRLFKDAEFITDAIADRRSLQRCQSIEIACGKTPQAAIAQPWFSFASQHFIVILPQFRQGLSSR